MECAGDRCDLAFAPAELRGDAVRAAEKRKQRLG
jgi:hypothetical protein